MENHLPEAAFYNCLNIATESSYKELISLRKKHSSWEEAWHNYFPKNIEPQKEWDKLQKEKVSLVLYEDAAYPSLLSEIPFPPIGIYVKGDLRPESQSVSIVGTRKASETGMSQAQKFSKQIADAGLGIVSGLALGIDSAAHLGALKADGYTIAVIACGIDKPYPKTNELLANKIIKNSGALISEYPLGAPALPYRFLERNRIVSGLSLGTLVVEAGDRSGALVTARFSVEQNREVFALPGGIEDPNHRGTNRLIKSGAYLVTSPEEILETLGLEPKTKNLEESTQKGETEEESRVLAILELSGSPLPVDKIIELTHLKAQVVLQTLSYLIIKKRIIEESRGFKLN